MLKLAYLKLRNLQTLRENTSRIVRIKDAKFSGYCFYMNTNIWGDFKICIWCTFKKLFVCRPPILDLQGGLEVSLIRRALTSLERSCIAGKRTFIRDYCYYR